MLQLPQSTVSRHLKLLADENWVAAEPDGASQLYRLSELTEGSGRARLWDLVRTRSPRPGPPGGMPNVSVPFWPSVTAAPVSSSIRRPASGTGCAKSSSGPARSYPHCSACSILRGWSATWAPGTGAYAAAVAPFVSRVIAVDESAPMLAAARARLNR